MAECTKIRIRHRQLCAGDLDRKINIQSRTIDEPDDMSTDFGNTFTTTKSVWAALKTTKGRDVFFATNLDQAVSHVFYTRYVAGMTANDWIQYKDENYDILETENLDERDEWMAHYCNVRGASSSELNNA